MPLRQACVLLALLLSPGHGSAAGLLLRRRRDLSAAAASERSWKSDLAARGRLGRSQGLARLLRVRSSGESFHAATNATPTAAELLEWANRLRAEEAGLASDVLAMQANMSSLEGLVNGLTANVTRVSRALAATMRDVQASAADRVELEADTAVVTKPELGELNGTEGMVRNMSSMVTTENLDELRNFSKWTPGGDVSQRVDAAEENLHLYEQAVQASVDRVLIANNSYELQAFVNATGLALSNLSNITGTPPDEVRCACPPCRAADFLADAAAGAGADDE